MGKLLTMLTKTGMVWMVGITLLGSSYPGMADSLSPGTGRPLFAYLYQKGTTDSIVLFSDRESISRYHHSAKRNEDTVLLHGLINTHHAELIPAGTPVRVLTREATSKGGVILYCARVSVRGGSWKGRTGYVLWTDLRRA